MSALAQEEKSILFIGNSFTFMNDMPLTFKAIAEAKGKKVYIDTVVEGGKNLDYHASRAETFEKIKSRKWDFVVVQGHSNELAQPDVKVDLKTLPHAEKIIDSIRQNYSCTQVVLYMTWGYKYGNHMWNPIATYDSMQLRIKNQYLRFADLLDARVCPVGEVWKSIRDNYAGINLYDPDNHHPSPAGSYISACTFYASIFGESPLRNNIPYKLDDNSRQIIEMNASQIVLNNLNKWRFIPNQNEMIPRFDLILMDKHLQLINHSKNYVFLEWNFGDNHISAEENPVHDYVESGTYQISLKLTNNCKTIVVNREITID